MIDYIALSETYRPQIIKTLLVGEAPPPSGKAYFYFPQINTRKLKRPIQEDRSLSSTIFYHYFQTRPQTIDEYEQLLQRLKEMGVWLIDLYEQPIPVRNNPGNQEIIKANIPKLRDRMDERNITLKDENIIFLLARNGYKSLIQQCFPDSQVHPWIDFRLQSNIMPKKLRILIHGFFGQFYNVELINGELIYKKHYSETVKFKPSKQAWCDFEINLNRLKIWDWKPNYDTICLDGISWEAVIHYPDKQIESGGSNGYPGSDDACQSPEFRRFLAIVRQLLGGLEFK